MKKSNARLKRERRAAKYGVTVGQWYQMPKAERERLKEEYRARERLERDQYQEEQLDMQQLSEWQNW
ncbi:hypothetical protein [Vibrio alginolyticus]|uniref:hypothetical protein n=1 Tax=Vibrio alginolyticus TaxID=663 RepID=UPI00104E0034|nr:hypothetical protein [Vibrio alginolyticus]EJX1244683.1 hypothetical protein [Vibrio alginolyticus]EJX1247189.1 hypothetical protein [Vibrio alginolyticus]TDE52093.1 hypothetical protein E1093_02795 [Vibrio alginolyticus]